MSTVLKAENIHKTFSFPTELEILKGISLEVLEGQSIAIMGASGEGKTTLLHILGTLEDASSGSIEIAGALVERKNSALLRKKHLGFIFQYYNLLDDFNAFDNVLMPARIAKSAKAKEKEVYHLLEEVGLKDRIHFPVKLLSGGEKQRVAIARALCTDPKIILADEPSGSLDHENAENIHNLLLQCAKKRNKSLIIATHNRDLALLCDRIYLLKEGKITLCSS